MAVPSIFSPESVPETELSSSRLKLADNAIGAGSGAGASSLPQAVRREAREATNKYFFTMVML